jgi:phosphoribosylformylglycinamidine (FGAM) synthase-like amidotransferase family enzyme
MLTEIELKELDTLGFGPMLKPEKELTGKELELQELLKALARKYFSELNDLLYGICNGSAVKVSLSLLRYSNTSNFCSLVRTSVDSYISSKEIEKFLGGK